MVDDPEHLPRADPQLLWYTALHHLIDEVVLLHRENRQIAFVSPSIERVLGYTVEEFTQLSTPEIIHPDDLPEAAETAVRLRSEPGSAYRSTLRLKKADGSWLWVDIVGQNLIEEPSVRGVIQTIRDVSERRALEEQLAHEANHDGLTDLANRSRFLGELELTLGESDPAAAVLYLDLDGFKAVNDTHGHGVGDGVLRVVAQRLRGAVRPGDLAARFGGDEFVALCRGIVDDEGAETVARRILDAVAGSAVVDGITVEIHTSVGVSRLCAGDTPDEALARADAGLYEAKRATKGTVRLVPHS